MAQLTLFKTSLLHWVVYLAILFCVVNIVSTQQQQHIPNLSDDDPLQKLAALILGRLDVMDSKLANIDARLTQLDDEIKLMKKEGKKAMKNIISSSNEIKLQGTNIIQEIEMLKEEGNTELIFNSSAIPAYVGQDINLECGYTGRHHHSCRWEHNDIIYQFADITNGSYLNMKAAAAADKSNRNQCGITIKSFNISDNGVWACKVQIFGQTLTGSKNVGCRDGFFMSSGSTQCFKYFNDDSRTWEKAKTMCKELGLDLAHPADAVAVTLRKDLVHTYGVAHHYWMDARADGSSYIWTRNQMELKIDNPLWWPGNPGSTGVRNNYCLLMTVYESSWLSHPDTPYTYHDCGDQSYTLCEDTTRE